MKMRIAACVVAMLSATCALGETVTIESYLSGGYGEHGGYTATTSFQNYFVGYTSPSHVPERRNYFLFDLSGITPGTVVSAKLLLYVPLFAPEFTTDPGPGYISPDPVEDYLITGTTVPPSVIADPTHPAAVAMGIFATFGTGPMMGSAPATASNMGGDLMIPITPFGVTGINLFAGGDFAITGRLTSLERRMGVLDELLFSFTDIPGDGMIDKPRLVLEIIPEPGAVALMFSSAALTLRRRR